MNKTQYERAARLADHLIKGLGALRANGPIPIFADLHLTARKLRAMLEPPPTMQQILDRVPGDTVTAKCEVIGVSRQGYYDLQKGTKRPTLKTVRLLAAASGVEADLIKAIW